MNPECAIMADTNGGQEADAFLAFRLRYLPSTEKRVKETKMNVSKKLAAIAVVAMTLATPSLFADNRNQETTDGWRGRSNHARQQTIEGRISDIDRDRNQFVIRLN